jgi:hypothetical protein
MRLEDSDRTLIVETLERVGWCGLAGALVDHAAQRPNWD